MADGSITFSTALDNEQLERDLKNATRDVDSLKRKLEGQQFERSWLENMMDRAKGRIEEATARVDELNDKLASLEAEQSAIDTDSMDPAALQRWRELGDEILETYGKIHEAHDKLSHSYDEHESYGKRWDVATAKAEEYERELERARTRASELAAEADRQPAIWQRAAEAIRSRFASAAEGIRSKMASAASKAASPWDQFSRRVGGMLKRVFVFGLILKGLGAIKNAIGSMLMQNERFNSSVSNLKATFNGVLSAITSAVMPALTALVNTLAGVLERIAGFIDSIFGTNLVAAIQGQRQAEGDSIRQANAQKQAEYDNQVAQEQARYDEAVAKAQEKQAKAEERQAKAARKLEKAQEKANRQLMSFDEINAMSAADVEEADEAIEDYADDIEGPDFSSIEAPQLETDWTLGDFGDAGMLQGVLDWLDNLKNRILNDVEGPFARIREGLQQIAKGWNEIVEGLRTGDFGLIWQGITDIVIGACKVIEGAFGALMDWLDEATGGKFTNIFQGLSEIVSGFVKVTEGLLTGDLGLVAEGMAQILNGVAQTIIGILEGIKTVFGELMDWLDEATGGRFHDIFEGLKGIVGGAVDFLVGLLTGNIPLAVQGLRDLVDGLAQFLTGTIDAIIGALSEGISWFFDTLSQQYPELAGFFQSTKDMILGVLNGIGTALNGVIEGARQIIQGYLDFVVGLVTGDIDKIHQGIDGLVNGIRTAVLGLADGIREILVGLFNWIDAGVEGLFDALAKQFPEAAGLFEGLKQTVLGILDVLEGTILGLFDGVGRALDDFLDGARQIIQGAVDLIVGIFTGSGDRIVEGLKSIVNGFITILEGMLDTVVSGLVGFVNGVADGLSRIPGVDIPSITFSSVSLPRLAQGAVIPPNREFMAVLGDQKSGNNIEAPESLMRQVVREEAGAMIAEAILALSSQREDAGGDVTLVLQVGYEELARATHRGDAILARRGELKPEILFG